ncbi:MAG: vitamin K epoxide reductase family protein [Thermoplasmata archaeon]
MQVRTLRTIVYLASGIGILLSLFAAAELFDAALSQICSFGGYVSCSAVANSGRTTFAFLPDWLWGLGGFVAIIAVNALGEQRPHDERYSYALLVLTTAGIAVALYFLYVEVGVIGALCLVCATAYGMGFIAWGASIGLARRARSDAEFTDAD